MASHFVVQQGTIVLCAHAAHAFPTVVNPRVRLGGAPSVALPVPWTVTACAPPAGLPCATAIWNSGTTRVTSMGLPLVIQGGTATCAPTGSPLTVTAVQSRVRCT